MCGVFTYLGNGSINLEQVTDAMHHRGPDSAGYKVISLPGFEVSENPDLAKAEGQKVALGFRRLAIIDLQDISNQPFTSADGKYHMVFNGEIYNYLELKQELIKEGVQFKTSSDTEVLLASYIAWGTKCFERFNGMWAVCIVDSERNKLVVSRDRFGIKPLYFYKHAHGISFFSEIKQILKTDYQKSINENVIRDFLESAVLDASTETFFKNIHKFPQSHFAEIDLQGQDYTIEPQRFWDLQHEEDNSLKYADAVERFRELFKDSIELRFRSDVPVGACLSGGLDSSSIVSYSGKLGKKINAFTVDNKDAELSEKKWVNDVVGSYESLSSVTTFNEENDLELLEKMFGIQDEPISGLGVIAQWRVMKLASENNVTVLLDGQGGDEILGGYRKFVFFYLKELVQKKKIPLALKEAFRFLSAPDFKIFEKEGVRRYLNKTGVSSFLSDDILKVEKQHNIGLSGASGFRTKSYEDIFKYSYPQLLRYEDRNSMAFSLESRVPFLDYRLVQMVYGFPASYKIRNGYTKAILRDSMKGILPDSVRTRKSKLGFATPEKRWITETHKEYFTNYFSKIDNPYLNNTSIKEEVQSGKNQLDFKSLLRMYLFDRWFNYQFGAGK